MQKNIYQLNTDQKMLCFSFIKKWKTLLFSTQQVNQQRAIQTIKKAYSFFNLPEPEIIFCTSHIDAQKFVSSINLCVENYVNLYSDLVELLRESMNLNEFILQIYSENPGLSSFFFI